MSPAPRALISSPGMASFSPVDTRASTTQARRIVYHHQWSASGAHKITVKVAGTAGRPTVSIDGWHTETGFPLPGLIKIDVEGVEIAALQGAHGVIRASRPVLLVEVHPGVGPAFADYFEGTLRPLGYQATSLTGGPMPLSNKRFHVVLLPEQST